MPGLTATKIESPESVQILRYIRNQTTEGFTSFNGFITPDQQVVWWESMKDRVFGWLYWLGDTAIVGYGLVREENGKWWNSIGVDPEYQGRGFGSYITHDVLLRFGGQVYATVRRDNPAAFAMHHTPDWEEIDGPYPDQLIYLRSRVAKRG